jgi:hypothetical protein
VPRLRLFLDCHTHCDRDYLRTEITMVDWVTDRTASHVHVIASGQSTGAGGNEVTLEYIGRGGLVGRSDTVVFRTPPDATSDLYRREFERTLRLGLVRYLLAAGQAATLVVEETVPAGFVAVVPSRDPWNHWVFTVQVDGELDGESRELGYEVGAEVRANRTTEDWKVRLRLGGDVDRTTFELDDGEEFTATRDGWSSRALVVRSVSPHWSLGGVIDAWSYKPDNLDFRARVGPAIEWNLYPYAEATRRQFVVLYTLTANRFDYVEETIFNEVEETRFDHQLQVAYETDQPWGSAYLSGSAQSFLHDWSLNRFGISGGIELRLARGLEFEVDGSYSRVRNQITLRKGDASDEEIFLQLRELATGYRASLNVGLSYTFGSFLNTVVNPRLDELD